MALSRPTQMVAMWMKKSRQVWTVSWGAWASSMGGSFAAVGRAMRRSEAVTGPMVDLRMSVSREGAGLFVA